MVSSSEIPGSYTTQWNAGTRQSTSRTTSSRRLSQPRYNSSCSNCRRSRVKCSGGNPCRRCGTLSRPTTCTYEASQRRGKHKAATGGPETDQLANQDVLTTNPIVGFPSADFSSYQTVLDDPLSLPDAFQFATDQANGSEAFAQSTPSTVNRPSYANQPNEAHAGIISHILDHETSSNLLGLHDSIIFPKSQPSSSNILYHFPSPPPPSKPGQLGSGECDGIADWDQDALESCSCYMTHQTLLHRLDVATKDLRKVTLDRILLLMQEVSTHTANHITCQHCSDGCPRLVNLAILHQSQVNLLCEVAKTPTTCGCLYGPEAVRFTLGVYRISDQDDLDYKRLTILAAVHKIKSSVASFDDLIRSSQDMEVVGDSEMPETTRINLRWLLDVARSLKGRLETIIAMLEKPGWALRAT